MTNKRILIIDDEDGMREIIQLSLEATTEWEIITAASGREGLAFAESEQPDAILLDVMMPRMDGPTTFKQLQGNSATNHIPAIFLTAKAFSNEQKELMQVGVSGIITKPFDPIELAGQVSKILGWKE